MNQTIPNLKSSFIVDDIIGYRFMSIPYGKPKLFPHIYFVDGLMIDTGQRRMQEEIFKAVKNLKVEQIYITHFHEDHTGNIDKLKSHYNCPVYASELCCEIMKAPPKLGLSRKLLWGGRPANSNLIAKSDKITTNKFEFEIISVPGHSSDMTALYEPNQKWLFSADLFINTHIGYFLKEESISEQISSIKKVLKLDFDVLLCSHNPQLVNGRQKLEQKLFYLLNFELQVSELYVNKFTPKQIFKKLKLKEFYGVKFLSNGELSKLNMIKSVIRDIEKKDIFKKT